MEPLQYVEEEFLNVERALRESLRFDYGPGQTGDYYAECEFRLKGIAGDLERLKTGAADVTTAFVVSQLWDLANRLALIERSHLGSFSWPFADAIRRKATSLLSHDEGLRGPVEPILHTIAEGTSYQISSEKVLGPNKRKRLITVAFPRQLKHHVLMHALFGHELGHATFFLSDTVQCGVDPYSSREIVRVLRREGRLKDCKSVMDWLGDEHAPPQVRKAVARAKSGITESYLQHWIVELICDLFGLMIFGPAFAAAHRAYLEPSSRSAHEVHIERLSHPSYALRRKIIVQALRILGWDQPVSTDHGSAIFEAETAFIQYLADCELEAWAEVFTDDQVRDALAMIRRAFKRSGTAVADRPEPAILTALVTRLARGLPPIVEQISPEGVVSHQAIAVEHQLYAGWTAWVGAGPLEGQSLTFSQINELCDMALLQQFAIDLSEGRRQL